MGSKHSDTGQPPAPDSELGKGNRAQQPSQRSVLGLGWPDLAALITATFAGVDLIAWLARGPVLQALVPSGLPGRLVDDSQVRGNGPRPRHLQAAGRAHGRPDRGPSEPGNGSTFYFDCLFAEVSGTQGSRAEVDRLPAVSNLLSPSLIAALRAGQKPLLLVVDDSPVNQRVAAAMLGKLGYRVDVAVNGIEAVSATAVRQYAAVIMDCQRPNMNGYEATAAIRSREGTGPHTPIIAMTASAMKGDLERCIAAGMDAYLSKPVTMKMLGETIAWIEPSQVPSASRIDSLKAVG